MDALMDNLELLMLIDSAVMAKDEDPEDDIEELSIDEEHTVKMVLRQKPYYFNKISRLMKRLSTKPYYEPLFCKYVDKLKILVDEKWRRIAHYSWKKRKALAILQGEIEQYALDFKDQIEQWRWNCNSKYLRLVSDDFYASHIPMTAHTSMSRPTPCSCQPLWKVPRIPILVDKTTETGNSESCATCTVDAPTSPMSVFSGNSTSVEDDLSELSNSDDRCAVDAPTSPMSVFGDNSTSVDDDLNELSNSDARCTVDVSSSPLSVLGDNSTNVEDDLSELSNSDAWCSVDVSSSPIYVSCDNSHTFNEINDQNIRVSANIEIPFNCEENFEEVDISANDNSFKNTGYKIKENIPSTSLVSFKLLPKRSQSDLTLKTPPKQPDIPSSRPKPQINIPPFKENPIKPIKRTLKKRPSILAFSRGIPKTKVSTTAGNSFINHKKPDFIKLPPADVWKFGQSHSIDGIQNGHNYVFDEDGIECVPYSYVVASETDKKRVGLLKPRVLLNANKSIIPASHNSRKFSRVKAINEAHPSNVSRSICPSGDETRKLSPVKATNQEDPLSENLKLLANVIRSICPTNDNSRKLSSVKAINEAHPSKENLKLLANVSTSICPSSNNSRKLLTVKAINRANTSRENLKLLANVSRSICDNSRKVSPVKAINQAHPLSETASLTRSRTISKEIIKESSGNGLKISAETPETKSSPHKTKLLPWRQSTKTRHKMRNSVEVSKDEDVSLSRRKRPFESSQVSSSPERSQGNSDIIKPFTATENIPRSQFTLKDNVETTSSVKNKTDNSDKSVETNTARNKRVNCEICHKSFYDSGTLLRHAWIHSSKKRFNCKICRKGFTQKSNFQVHLRVHTGAKPFTCIYCGKGFSQKHHVVHHQYTHTGERPYSCKVCGKAFSKVAHLKIHGTMHTKIKPFKCPQCPKTFALNEYLKGHLKVHSNVKPFSCKICRARFKLKHSLKHHTRAHTEGKTFICCCNAAYTYPSALRKHMTQCNFYLRSLADQMTGDI